MRRSRVNYAIRHKHARYDESFQGSDYDFAAVVCGTSGAVNTEGARCDHTHFSLCLQAVWNGPSAFCGRTWARLACRIQTSVAQMILNRESVDPIVACADIDA